MNLWFITGFSDAESSFIINIIKNNKHKTGWAVNSCFSIGLHKKHKVILEKFKKYFCVGRIYKHGENMRIYKVVSVKYLLVIINHFNKYSLITQKRADFELFSQAVELIQAK